MLPAFHRTPWLVAAAMALAAALALRPAPEMAASVEQPAADAPVPAAARAAQQPVQRPATARRPPAAADAVPDDRRDVQVPTSGIVAAVTSLESRLRAGDSAAGYPLFALLEQCARAPAIAEQLRRDRRDLPSGPVALPESLLNEAQYLESECARLPPALLARRFEFLELAAAHGDLRARLDYAAYPPEYFATAEGLVRHAEKVVEFKAKAMAWLHAAADHGSPIALLKLAGLYREGVLVERDDVAALAYYLAWDEVGGNGGGVDPYRQQREWSMTPAQLEQAREMQRRIVARCCR